MNNRPRFPLDHDQPVYEGPDPLTVPRRLLQLVPVAKPERQTAQEAWKAAREAFRSEGVWLDDARTKVVFTPAYGVSAWQTIPALQSMMEILDRQVVASMGIPRSWVDPEGNVRASAPPPPPGFFRMEPTKTWDPGVPIDVEASLKAMGVPTVDPGKLRITLDKVTANGTYMDLEEALCAGCPTKCPAGKVKHEKHCPLSPTPWPSRQKQKRHRR